jgi:hypothetical protein
VSSDTTQRQRERHRDREREETSSSPHTPILRSSTGRCT